MSKTVRFLLAFALLFTPMWIRPAVAASSSGGPVVLMGIDAEDGGVGGHGPITVYQAVARDIRSKVQNGGNGILVIGGGKSSADQATAFWNAIGSGIGQSVTYVNGTAISTRSFAGFAMIGVVSDVSNTPSGGLTQDENNRLASRQAEVAAFINNGGGLFGFTSDFTNPYAYLSGVGSFTFSTGLSYQDITPTAAGSAIGISNALDICCWHDEYPRFPNFLGVLATNPLTGRAAAIGGANVFVSDIQLTPATASSAVNTAHTLTATIQENGAPVAGKSVSFSIASGPHAGTTSTATTDSTGKARFTYTGTRAGTDTIVARYVDSRGNSNSSNQATKAWINQAPPVNAGPDVAGSESDAINLSGSASDPEGDALTHSWSYAAVSGVDTGATCAIANPGAYSTTITCTDDGVYRATLTVSDGINAAVADSALVTVSNVAPTASFTATPQVDEVNAFTLSLANPTDPSSTDRAAGFTYAFDCGTGYGAAGSASTASCPTTDNGTRTVKAKISDKDGGATEYVSTVNINNVAPTADFTASPQVDEGSSISLQLSNPVDPSSADRAAGFTYAFDCGTGYGAAGSTATASCATNDNGTRTVKAKISDKDGGATEYISTVSINNVAPTADFIVNPQVDEGSAFTLKLANPVDPSSADRAAGFTYAFDCGTGYGAAGSTSTVSCATTDNGTRAVKAKITDKNGGVTEYTSTVSINNVAPVADFTTSPQVDEGSAFTLKLANPVDPSSVDTAAGFTYAFDCGSGYSTAGSTSTVSCATTDNGLRTVKAKIADKDGAVTEYVSTVRINSVAPIANFTASSPVNEGSSISLALTSPSDPSSADTAAGFKYTFDCDDGQGYRASAGSSATCATNDNSIRTVKAKISDKDGAWTEYTATSTVNNVAPQATFSASSQVSEGEAIELALTNPSDPSGMDTAAGFTYAFSCGGAYSSAGSTSTATCATNDNGTRTVKATIADKDGGMSEYTATSTINNVAPQATFSASSEVDEGEAISLELSNASDPSSVDTAAGFSYAFNCGSAYGSAGSTSTATCATNDNGTRVLKAKISDKDGGVTEYSATSTVNNIAPQAIFSASSEVDEGEAISLELSNASDPSSADTAAGFSYTFNCGSAYGSAGSTSTATCATNDNGTRVLKAKIADKDGGVTEYTATSTVNNIAPQAIFSASSEVDEGEAISLELSNASDPSSVDTAAGFSYAFNCGTSYAAASGTATATCTTNDSGTRTVKATITDKDGGVTEYSATSTINNVAPQATFSATSPLDEGGAINLELSNASDPSSADTTAGFKYAFDCGTGYGAAGSTATAPCATTDSGVRTVKARISDKDGGVTEYSATSIVNNVAPTAQFPAVAPLNEGSSFSLQLTNPSDPSSVDTAAGFKYAFDCGTGYGATSSTATANCATDDSGTRTVKARISDKDGGTTEYTSTVTVKNVAPTATFSSTSPVNEGSAFTLKLTNASDPSSADTAEGFTYTFDCNDGYGFRTAGSTATIDCSTADNGTRAVVARIADKDGGVSEYTGTVTINNVAPTVGTIVAPIEPMAVGTVVNVRAPFTDPGSGDTHTAVVDWDDNSTSAGTVSYSDSETGGTPKVEGSHSYTTPGIYTIKITVTDDDGGSGSSSFLYVVVYDPSGGFVTGGGFITSPAGAYVKDPSATGRANFGFNSKYLKGATVPTGQTEFQFKAGNLNFHSSSYEWLVVAGARAQYKGVGTINGNGSYGFMLTAIDGQVNGGGGSDKFRIKIWDKSAGDAVVYDNQMGGADDANPTTTLQGGSIVIHKGN